MDPRRGVLPRADVLVKDGKIAAVVPDLRAEAEVIDASSTVVAPGFVDAHRHFWAGALRRAIPNADGAAYSKLANDLLAALRPEDARLATHVGGLTSIHGGVTTVQDYSHLSKSPEICDAAIAGHRASGVRAVYCYAETRDDSAQRSNPTGSPRSLSRPPFPDDLERLQRTHFSGADDLLSLRLGVSYDFSRRFALARRAGLGITCDGVFGVSTPTRSNSWSPILRDLVARGDLGSDVALIHGTALPDDVLEAMARTRTGLILAPTSDGSLRGLGNSTTPIEGAMRHGLLARTGISTDIDVSLSSDLFAQMRAVFLLQRVLASRAWQRGAPDPLDPITVQQVLGLATLGGARALGMEDRIGSLTPGKDADIILVRYGQISSGLLNSAVGHLVIGAGPEDVDTVIIKGKIRKRRGVLLDVDESGLMEAFARSRDYLAAASGVWSPGDVTR
jgi:cytosine/adenosine deaminase-related metal-dependent hydrolase